MQMDETTQIGIETNDDRDYHPGVNPQNHRVQRLPARLSRGDVLARVDTWTRTETSHWVVQEAEESARDTDAGYRYRIDQVGGDQAQYISHGEIQLAVARGEVRLSSSAPSEGSA